MKPMKEQLVDTPSCDDIDKIVAQINTKTQIFNLMSALIANNIKEQLKEEINLSNPNS